jgi:alpha-beta hydrolase superfamily lysophospholipase
MRLLRILALFLITSLGLVMVAWLAARPPVADAFYDTGTRIPEVTGALLKAEPFNRTVPTGAMAWRILYTTTRLDNAPAIASAIVMISEKPAPQPRPVVAWAHGTTGIARGCAPSLSPKPFANVPALEELLAEGWAYVATDYAGLGTSGPHGYLVGDDAARSVLDAVRAARKMQDISLDARSVIWGHSQGGHAALWSAISAPVYAPDVPVLGVAAFAPATDLPALMAAAQSGGFGKIVASYVVHAYAAIYPDIDVASTIPFRSLWLAADIAGRCVGGYETLFTLAQTWMMPASGLVRSNAIEGALGVRMRENTPDSHIAAPVFVAQGQADDLVLASIQQRFVRSRCSAGQPMSLKMYPDLDHISLVSRESPLGPDVIRWTRERFSGLPAVQDC